MKNKYKIRVYDWNPNGTNDISIINSHSDYDTRCEDGLQEALFGIDITKVGKRFDYNSSVVSLEECLKHIAISPVEDGSTTVKFLKKYFILNRKTA